MMRSCYSCLIAVQGKDNNMDTPYRRNVQRKTTVGCHGTHAHPTQTPQLILARRPLAQQLARYDGTKISKDMLVHLRLDQGKTNTHGTYDDANSEPSSLRSTCYPSLYLPFSHDFT